MKEKEYNREKAVEYAHKWAFSRNPKFYNYDSIGGDCTNFASQCIYAGSGVMNYSKVNGWYYISSNNKSPSWTGVEFLYNFLTTNKGIGPFGKEVEVSEVLPGDIVQLSFDGKKFGHSPVIVEASGLDDLNTIIIAAHTYDSDYREVTSYNYKKLRFIHIEGVRI